ncbi:hypothetical protein [Accumulibacter sp.]|uniref:hypothetical protein n=1 Tax=Accumulibacter sp. TaxID=2053492 RepID=UPI0025F56833|nr:hypothetical protein [Accumulibacter sp.]MCM8596513.1 hypothetical protein [Accumulibacter sp.]MCM8627315.1 hypothetical protein [Accumulibacter sp.]MDS4050662.1 hypothetical protein [Accumulibacter sp.]
MPLSARPAHGSVRRAGKQRAEARGIARPATEPLVLVPRAPDVDHTHCPDAPTREAVDQRIGVRRQCRTSARLAALGVFIGSGTGSRRCAHDQASIPALRRIAWLSACEQALHDGETLAAPAGIPGVAALRPLQVDQHVLRLAVVCRPAAPRPTSGVVKP